MNRKVLVADDDDAMRTLVAFALDDEGFDTIEAASGAEVLRLLDAGDRSGADATSFDLVIMDIRMPGLSGLDAVRRLRGRQCSTPVILMTAFADRETTAAAEALDVPVLSKPFTLSELSTVTERALGSSAQR